MVAIQTCEERTTVKDDATAEDHSLARGFLHQFLAR
jgi:hypothetical protein